MLRSKSQRSNGDQDGPDACQENIRAIKVREATEFASQPTEPQNHVPRPGVSNMIHKQGRNHDQDKDATHTLQGLHTHIFDIQPILLIKAIGMFIRSARCPLSTGDTPRPNAQLTPILLSAR